MSRPDKEEGRQSRRSFVTRLLTGTAGLWVTATGVGMALAGRARTALASEGGAQTQSPEPLGRPKPKYGVRRPRKYGGPPTEPQKPKPKPPQRSKKYGGPPQRSKKYGGPPQRAKKYGGPPQRSKKYGGPPQRAKKYGGKPRPPVNKTKPKYGGRRPPRDLTYGDGTLGQDPFES